MQISGGLGTGWGWEGLGQRFPRTQGNIGSDTCVYCLCFGDDFMDMHVSVILYRLNLCADWLSIMTQ